MDLHLVVLGGVPFSAARHAGVKFTSAVFNLGFFSVVLRGVSSRVIQVNFFLDRAKFLLECLTLVLEFCEALLTSCGTFVALMGLLDVQIVILLRLLLLLKLLSRLV